jgi:hypothetical protein
MMRFDTIGGSRPTSTMRVRPTTGENRHGNDTIQITYICRTVHQIRTYSPVYRHTSCHTSALGKIHIAPCQYIQDWSEKSELSLKITTIEKMTTFYAHDEHYSLCQCAIIKMLHFVKERWRIEPRFQIDLMTLRAARFFYMPRVELTVL